MRDSIGVTRSSERNNRDVRRWLLFVGAQSYYSGAMTMFFTAVPGLPFQTMEEALNAFPAWKMVVDEAEVSQILYRAKAGEPGFVVKKS